MCGCYSHLWWGEDSSQGFGPRRVGRASGKGPISGGVHEEKQQLQCTESESVRRDHKRKRPSYQQPVEPSCCSKKLGWKNEVPGKQIKDLEEELTKQNKHVTSLSLRHQTAQEEMERKNWKQSRKIPAASKSSSCRTTAPQKSGGFSRSWRIKVILSAGLHTWGVCDEKLTSTPWPEQNCRNSCTKHWPGRKRIWGRSLKRERRASQSSSLHELGQTGHLQRFLMHQ